MKILIIEDEKKLGELIKYRLEKELYQIDISLDGGDGLYKSLSGIYDLIILDIMLPFKDGFTILKEIRDNNIDSFVIVLTAKSELDDKLLAFSNGADDYLTKPFHIEELVARVNSKLKTSSLFLEYGDIKLDLKRKSIISKKTNEEVEVLCKEFFLLEYLMKNNDKIVAKEFLYDAVWGINNEVSSNNLEAYISFIRNVMF